MGSVIKFPDRTPKDAEHQPPCDFELGDSAIVWECACGGQHFYITIDGPICAHCGDWHDIGEIAEGFDQ